MRVGFSIYLQLVKIFRAFYETLRLFPPVTIPKTSVEDTVFVCTNMAGERRPIAVPQGSIVRFDVVGLHRNREYLEHDYQILFNSPSTQRDTGKTLRCSTRRDFWATGPGRRSCHSVRVHMRAWVESTS